MTTTKGSYTKALEGKRPVRGLWLRDGHFYVQLRRPNKLRPGVTVPVKERLLNPDGSDPQTVPQAKKLMHAVQGQKGTVGVFTPASMTIAKAVETYLAEQEALKRKLGSSLKRETSCLRAWVDFGGDRLVSSITLETADEFAAWRGAQEICGRTIDIDIMALRNVIKKQNQSLKGWEKLAGPPARTRLMEAAEIDRLCEAAEKHMRDRGRPAPCEYGKQFSEYLRLLSLTGSRETESLHLTRGDVDWMGGQIWFRVTKNKRTRSVDIGPILKPHLEAMWKRRGWEHSHTQAQASALLFPSPRTAEIISSNRKGLQTIMKKAGINDFGFHHLRHYFISHCVMAGLDYMTIAAWVGHRDGGVLIGKVYGHINNEHRKRQAAKLTFGAAMAAESSAAVA